MPVYARTSLAFERGEGVYLYTAENERYLDFAAGIAVNALGHCHPQTVKALKDQAAKLWHVSNLYQAKEINDLADLLCEHSFADQVFFCNSGAEAVECGIKMIRKYHHENGEPHRTRIITFEGAFHGRTIATLSAAKNEKHTEGFGPMLEGFDQVARGDVEALKAAIGPNTAGILIEPIRGEGGVDAASIDYLKALRDIADAHGLLLFLDSVQCGMGRSGKLYPHEWASVNPDILSSAKGIGNGFPLGACLATKEAAKGMKPGSHGSTYGSNPLAMQVGKVVVETVVQPQFLENVQKQSAALFEKLEMLRKAYPNIITSLHGKGLMIGVKVAPNNAEFVAKLREKKLLTVPAGQNMVRLLPPLVITEEHVDEAIAAIESVCKEMV